MNKIEINFIPCLPTPPRGYNVGWRVEGSDDLYTDAGNFFISPAVFYDHTNPDGTCYEGYIRADNGEVFCDPVIWKSCIDSGDPDPGYEITLIGGCTGIESSYLVSGGVAGDTVTVRATFSGILQRNANIFTKACVGIACVDGVSDPQVCSTCYTDTAIHGFSIFVDTVITMPGAMSTVLLSARIMNGSISPTSVIMTIIDVNGSAMDISCSGCRGNEGVGGTC